MRVFEDRRDAGRQLAAALVDDPGLKGDHRVVVLAIPRGGLPVGAEVARAIGAEFDVVVVRKLRTPQNPELGFGAVSSDGHVEIDQDLVQRLQLTQEQIRAEIDDRLRLIEQRLALYRSVAPPVDLTGALVIVADDGIATGATAREACALARRMGAVRVVLAAPVAPPRAAIELASAADHVLILCEPEEFIAVGQVYENFSQLDDASGLELLRELATRDEPR
jgi:putative phosphoribosyl transferase